MNGERQIYYEEGGNIGKLLIMEFEDGESTLFDEIMRTIDKYPDFHRFQLKDEAVLSLPGLKICPERRKIYSESQEINLTTKEFEILYILAINKGRVVTYEQIYRNVWNEYPAGGENCMVGYHVRNLRKKLCMVSTVSIECTREIGYCFSVESEKP